MGDTKVTKSSQKVAKFFYCENCDYKTYKKCNIDKHLSTAKHYEVTKGDIKVAKSSQKIANHMCSHCDKIYSSRNGLWKHQKKCPEIRQISTETIGLSGLSELTETSTNQLKIFADVIKTTVIEIMKSEGSNNINQINTQINNQINNQIQNNTFNLNFYLNETCKDAINIEDFVRTIKVQLEDLENTGRVGYVDGMSDIILNNLNSIKTHKRPIHCTDEKREVLYIKNDGEWVKETFNKSILTNAIKTIANENIKQITKWKNTYPDCVKADSKKNNLYLKIVSNAMSGLTKEECDKNYNKIIKNIIKKTTINKDNLVTSCSS